MPNLGLETKEVRAITSFLVSFQPEEEDEKFATPEDWKQYLSSEGDPKRGEIFFMIRKELQIALSVILSKGGAVLSARISVM